MIGVARHPPPAHYEAEVKSPGERFLADFPCAPPVPADHWKRHEYWRRVGEALWQLYGGICAYTVTFIEPASAYWGTVDHFKPKSQFPEAAYDWDNFRLASTVANSPKRSEVDVLDPFDVQEGWFGIDMETLRVGRGRRPTRRRRQRSRPRSSD